MAQKVKYSQISRVVTQINLLPPKLIINGPFTLIHMVLNWLPPTSLSMVEMVHFALCGGCCIQINSDPVGRVRIAMASACPSKSISTQSTFVKPYPGDVTIVCGSKIKINWKFESSDLNIKTTGLRIGRAGAIGQNLGHGSFFFPNYFLTERLSSHVE